MSTSTAYSSAVHQQLASIFPDVPCQLIDEYCQLLTSFAGAIPCPWFDKSVICIAIQDNIIIYTNSKGIYHDQKEIIPISLLRTLMEEKGIISEHNSISIDGLTQINGKLILLINTKSTALGNEQTGSYIISLTDQCKIDKYLSSSHHGFLGLQSSEQLLIVREEISDNINEIIILSPDSEIISKLACERRTRTCPVGKSFILYNQMKTFHASGKILWHDMHGKTIPPRIDLGKYIRSHQEYSLEQIVACGSRYCILLYDGKSRRLIVVAADGSPQQIDCGGGYMSRIHIEGSDTDIHILFTNPNGSYQLWL